MTNGRFAQSTFEEEHFIGQIQRLTMQKINLHLTRAHLVNQRVYVQIHRLGVVVNVLKQRVKFVHRVNAVRLATGFAAAIASDRRNQQLIRIGVFTHQIELQFRCNYRRPALFGIQVFHAAQHRARRELHQ